MGNSQPALRHPYGFIVLATTCLFVLISAHIGLSQGSPVKPYRVERLQPQELAREAFLDDGMVACSTRERLYTPCNLRKSTPVTDLLQAANSGRVVKSGTTIPHDSYEQGIPQSPYSVVSVPRGPPLEMS
jgi:hypothetical protein